MSGFSFGSASLGTPTYEEIVANFSGSAVFKAQIPRFGTDLKRLTEKQDEFRLFYDFDKLAEKICTLLPHFSIADDVILTTRSICKMLYSI
ncbi:MAG: hypothetical protein AAB305_05280 [Candidatus Zixiibacteriota bacterium]